MKQTNFARLGRAFCAVLGVLQLLNAGSAQRPGTPDKTRSTKPPSAAAGRKVFESRCAACHGLDGRGGEHAPDIVTNPNRSSSSDQTLFRIIRDGIPRRGMPGFSLVLTPAQIREVVVFLRRPARTRPPDRPQGVQDSDVRPVTAPITSNVDVDPQDLLTAPPQQNWLSYNGDYSGRRYTSLDQINPQNVSQLRAQWIFHSSNSDSMEVTPLVVNGVMYITSANDAFALDARTGRALWHYARPITEGLIDDAAAHHNRGVALWHSRVYMETDNAHLLCLDARSGHLLWEVTYADAAKNYGATSAPSIVKDKVIVGTSGGDDGVRGFLAAFDILTGKLAWRFWTIPGPGEFGSSSWPGDAYLHGGGTTWMPGTYDPELNTLYWCTSNPAPDFAGETRPGDDLYTDCVLALDPDTGKLKWYFQFTPHDLFDYDATETPILVDARLDGALRRLLVQANRNGFLYILDRADGKFSSATRFVEKLNWATGIDPNGRPILTGVKPTPQGTKICPAMNGATNWFSPSYNPATELCFFLALEDCEMYFSSAKPERSRPGRMFYGSGTRRIRTESGHKTLIAFNVATGKLVWKYPQAGDGSSWGGTMTTASGLVFFGDDTGEFEAVDARSGAPLWHFNTGQSFHASPMSYAVDGVQYVAIAAGSDMFSFALRSGAPAAFDNSSPRGVDSPYGPRGRGQSSSAH